MRIICDICGGGLQINSGGQGAICTVCHLNYAMSRLREKLNLQMMNVPELAPPAPEPPGSVLPVALKTDFPTPPAVSAKMETEKPARAVKTERSTVVPKQFSLRPGRGKGHVSGTVQQGGIGLGDKVYINYDYSHPYVVSQVNDGDICAKEGMQADLYLRDCPPSVLRNVFAVSGAPRPSLSGHNYPGPLEEYFLYVLERQFPDCRIDTNVPKTGSGLNKPVDFVVYRDEKPLLAVILVDRSNNADRYRNQKAAELFMTEGVACTHFYRDYRNDMPYVVERIKKALNQRAN